MRVREACRLGHGNLRKMRGKDMEVLRMYIFEKFFIDCFYQIE